MKQYEQIKPKAKKAMVICMTCKTIMISDNGKIKGSKLTEFQKKHPGHPFQIRSI